MTATRISPRRRALARPWAALLTLGLLLLSAGARAERLYFSEYDYPTDKPDSAFYYVEVPLPENPDGPGYLYKAHYRGNDALYAEGVRSGPGKDDKWLGDWRYLYPDGQVKEKGHNDAQGRPNGELISYHENGQVEKYKPYRDGSINGVEKEYDEDGNLLLKRQVKDGRPDGMQIYYYGDGGGPDGGQIHEERRYRDGNYDNFYNRYDRDGNHIGHADYIAPGVLMAWTRDRDGNYTGREAFFQRDDQGRFRNDAPLWLRVNASYDDHGKPRRVNLYYPRQHSEWITGFLDGTVVRLEHKVNDIRQGHTILPRDDGGREQGEMRDGLRTGTWRGYDARDQLIRVRVFEKGRLQGESRQRSGPDGKRWTYTHYQQDQKDGPWRTENAAGEVVESGQYRNGVPVGDWRTLDQNDAVEKATYVDGKLDGDWSLHATSGALLAERHYRRGQAVGEWKSFREDGTLLTSKTFRDGKLNGPVYERHDNGHQIHAHFQADSLHGDYLETTEQGYPLLEGHYRQGKRDGRFVEYGEDGRVETITPYRDGKADGKGWIRDRDQALVPARWQQGRRVEPAPPSNR